MADNGELTTVDRGRLPSGSYKQLEEHMVHTMSILDMDDDDMLEYVMELQKRLIAHQLTWSWHRQPERFIQPTMEEPWHQLEPGRFQEITAFVPDDFLRVCDLFVRLPDKITTSQRRTAHRRLCFFILLARWHSESGTWSNLARQISMCRTKMIDLYGATCALIMGVEDYVCLSMKLDVARVYPRVPEFAEAVWEAGGLCEECCIGTVDCSGKPTCRPSKKAAAKRKFTTADVQKYAYTANPKAHRLTIQNVMLVDGMSIIDVKLISDHDAKVLKDSGIIEQLRSLKDLLENSDDDDDVYGRLQQYSRIMIYGDPAYRNLDVVKRKSKGLRTLWQRVLDKSMQPSRATVEDAFAYLVITFPYFRNKIKFQLLRVAQASFRSQLIVMNIFLNLHTCFYGNQVNSFFSTVEPPSAEEYMASANDGSLVAYHAI